MVDNTDNWSRHWNSSTNPSKQRKYRDNAPLHVKDNLISANLDAELREELGTRNINLRTGDRVEIMRGDQSGIEGIVNNIDRSDLKVFISGVNNTRQDGSTNQKAFDPSNLQVTALNIEDPDRLEKYDVKDYESIKVDEDEIEEALAEDEEGEMMERMKDDDDSEQETVEEQEEVEESEEESSEDSEEVLDDGSEEEPDVEEDTEESVDDEYQSLVSQNISEVKEGIEEMEEVDYDKAIEAEKSDKNRKTMIEWLENQKE